MPTLFLSHSSKDKFFVGKLAEKFNEHGVKVWIDEAEIKIGDSLLEKITEGVKTSDYLVIILSHNSVESNWVQKELQMAMTREILGSKVILPLLIEKCEIPFFLKDKLYADFTDPREFDNAFVKLLDAIGINNKHGENKKERPHIEVTSKNSKSIDNYNKTIMKQSKLEVFEDIKIIGVDKDKTYNPDPHKLLYNVYFELSRIPPSEWVEIFDVERRFPRHTMWRKAWIERGYVIVHCSLDEVKKYHLNDITEDVKTTNFKYREYLQKVELQRQRQLEKEEKERNTLEESLNDLDFT